MLQDFYTKLSPQEKKILYAAIGAITLWAIDFMFFQSVSTKLNTLDQEIKQTTSDIKRDVRYLAYQDKILKENKIFSRFQSVENKTDDEITAAFLKTIENLATEANVTKGKINPGETVKKSGFTLYYANIECTGTMDNLVNLVHKIDSTDNLLKVTKLSLAGKKSSADEITVVMKICKLVVDFHDTDQAESTEDEEIVKNAILESGGSIEGVFPDSGGNTSNGKMKAPSDEIDVGGSPGELSPSGQMSDSGGPNGSGGRPAKKSKSPKKTKDNVQKGDGQGQGDGEAGAESAEEELPLDPASLQPADKKSKVLPEGLNTGQRLKAKKSLGEWWNDLWGIKPKEPEEEKPQKKDENWTSPDDELKPTLIQQMLEKKKNE